MSFLLFVFRCLTATLNLKFLFIFFSRNSYLLLSSIFELCLPFVLVAKPHLAEVLPLAQNEALLAKQLQSRPAALSNAVQSKILKCAISYFKSLSRLLLLLD